MQTRVARPWIESPRGWYALATSAELVPGSVHSQTWFGRPLVLWRTASGVAVVAGAHCPHLGAHLGRGGRVEGENLHCPFHDFAFGPDGRCVSTPYGQGVPKARLGRLPVREQDGWVLAWWDPEAGEPTFAPEPQTDDGDWSALRTHRFELRTHPQDVVENSVDVGHLSVVHGYRNARCVAPLEVSGSQLRVTWAMDRDGSTLGVPGQDLEVEFAIVIDGLGVSRVEVHTPLLALRTRHWVMPVPIGDGRCELRIGVQARRGPLRGPLFPLRIIGRILAWDLVGRFLIRAFAGDVSQDIPIWEHKKHLHPPMLARGDGPIGRYRSWARQFHA